MQRQSLLRGTLLERERLDEDDDSRGEHDEREQEVGHHEQRVQSRVHGERAERRLRERADERRERKASDALGQPRRHAGVPSHATSVAKIVTALTMRLPNSMNE